MGRSPFPIDGATGPKVVGNEEDAAIQKIENANLEYEIVEEAIKEIRNAGLQVIVTSDKDDSKDVGIVLKQDVEAGSNVEQNSVV